MFFSISPNEYYNNLQEELWGCFKYIGMPWDMIMSLPIQERRNYIRRHNIDQEAERGNSTPDNQRRYEGEVINDYAKLDMNKRG